MEPLDLSPSSSELLEAELETLMWRLIQSDSAAWLRLEKLFIKIKMERIVDRHFH